MRAALLVLALSIPTTAQALTCPDYDDPEVLTLHTALVKRLTLGSGAYVRHCRRAPEGCYLRLWHFASAFVEAGRAYSIDPWLLAALGIHESGLSPAAESWMNTRGILQLHPRSRSSEGVRFVRGSRAYRRWCLHQHGACQRSVVMAGASYLRAATDKCGTIQLGLGAYGTGRCVLIPHIRRVYRERALLLRLAR